MVGAGSPGLTGLLSPVDELVCAPPELCTIPSRGSTDAESSLGGDELPWTATDVDEAFEELVDSPVEVAFVEAGSDAVFDVASEPGEDESDGEPAADEPEDELGELESVGSANATAGVFATTTPTPSATASAPTRPMYCVAFGILLRPCCEVPTRYSVFVRTA
jgi:hypothetical protein